MRPIGMWANAARVFAEHDGVATFAQLRAAGVTERVISARARSGEILRVTRGLYRSAQHPHSDRAGVRIAVSIAGGVADRWTALFWHGMTAEPADVVTVTVPSERRLGHTAGYRISTRRRWLDPLDVTERDGLSVTDLPLTVLEVCDASVMDRALQRRAVSVAQLARALERNSHTVGIRRARAIFAVASSDTESAAERLFVRLLRSAGVTGWCAGMRFGRYVLDFAFVAHRVAVEINGWAYHRSRDRWMRDQDKANALAASGWVLLNFSWYHLQGDPDAVIAAVVRVLSDRSAARSTE